MRTTKAKATPVRTPTTRNADEDVEPQELSFTPGGIATWCSHYGRQPGGFLQN